MSTSCSSFGRSAQRTGRVVTDDDIDLRYQTPVCGCGFKACIKVVEGQKDSRGKLYCVCACQCCRFFQWLQPSTIHNGHGRGRSQESFYDADAAVEHNAIGFDDFNDLQAKYARLNYHNQVLTMIVIAFALLCFGYAIGSWK